MLLWYWGRRGGGAQYALSLARALAPDVALSLSRQGELAGAFRALPVPRQEVDTYRGAAGFAAGTLLRLPVLGAALRGFARREAGGVVVSAMSHPWTPLLAPGLRRDGLAFIPVIHDAAPHPGDPSPLFFARLDRELSAAAAAVTLSTGVADAIAARRPDLTLIRLTLPAHLPHGPAARAPDGAFLFFGRLRAYKGLDLLRDAWRAVAATHPAARLRIVGEGDAAALAPGIEALPGVLLENRWVADDAMAGLIAGSRAVVLPYREASQSGVLPLALALGVPVVATAVGGLAEALAAHPGAGLLVPPEAGALADALRQMLDPETHARLAAGAAAAGPGFADWAGHAAALRAGIAEALGR